MKAIFLFILMATISFNSFADNHPYYQKEDALDVKYAVSDIFVKKFTKCEVKLEQFKKEASIETQASFFCGNDFDKYERFITWAGRTKAEFLNLIRDKAKREKQNLVIL